MIFRRSRGRKHFNLRKKIHEAEQFVVQDQSMEQEKMDGNYDEVGNVKAVADKLGAFTQHAGTPENNLFESTRCGLPK